MNNYSLARRRAQEKICTERENFLKDECRATYYAKWEAQTSIRIEKRDIQNRAHQLAEIDAKSLKQRQLSIKDLYVKDDAEWAAKISELQNISIDDRINKLREKAFRLKEKRENENQDFVKQCYQRRWREGCDELRTLHSKAITDKVMLDRKYAFGNQIENKRGSKTKLDMQIQLPQERNETQTVMEKNMETKKALDAQLDFIRKRNEKIKEEQKREERQKVESWRNIDKLEREKEITSHVESRARGDQILLENAKRIQDREKECDVHRKQDLLLLKHALAKEHKEIQSEKNQKNQGKEEAKAYLQFLKDQMIKVNEENAMVDAIRSEEMDKIWKKREDEEKNKHDMRKKVLEEVHKSRLLQIRDKETNKQKEKEDLARQVAISQLEWERQEEAEKKESYRKKQETIQNMLANKAVMEEKSKEKEKKISSEHFVQKQMQIEEKEHLERIQREAGNVVTSFPRRSSKMFS